MPIYCDNRKLLRSHQARAAIIAGFSEIINKQQLKPDVIGGIATAGIPHAAILAHALNQPMAYVRAKAKEHGLGNRIEGEINASENVILIEDVISTGGSSLSAVEAVREVRAKCGTVLSIFSYDFPEALNAFREKSCALHAIYTYHDLVAYAVATNYVSAKDGESLNEWRENPYTWGEKHGFPKS